MSFSLSKRYLKLLSTCPLLVVATFLSISFCLSIFAVYYHEGDLSLDPKRGFEARGSTLSHSRLALQAVQKRAISPSAVIKLASDIVNSPPTNRVRRNHLSLNELQATTEPSQNFTINYDDYGVADDRPFTIEDIRSPCDQYYAMGRYVPEESTLYMAKAVFEVRSWDDLFDLGTMKRLCRLDKIISAISGLKKRSRDRLSPLPFSFHLPYYVSCLDRGVGRNCSGLTQENVNQLREEIEKCAKMNETTVGDERESGNCGTHIAQQIRDFILPKGLSLPSKGSIYLGAVLKLRLLQRPFCRNDYDLTMDLLDALEESFPSNRDHSKISLRGLELNAVELLFQYSLLHDILVAIGAVSLVFLLVWLQSDNLLLSFVVLAGMAGSVGLAFFVYSCVLGIGFFPFVNLLAVVIAVVVGVDDAFLLIHHYEKEKARLDESICRYLNIHLQYSTPDAVPSFPSRADSGRLGAGRPKLAYSLEVESTKDRDRKIFGNGREEALNSALKISMNPLLVTSLTTAVAFASNCLSDIVVVRCFGCFAALTITFNYLFVVSALPAAIYLLDGKTAVPVPLMKPVLYSLLKFDSLHRAMLYQLPKLVSKLRLLLCFILLGIVPASVYVVAVKPTITLQRGGHTQLLQSTHPFERFRRNHASLFNFSASYRGQMGYHNLGFYAVWGVEPINELSPFSADEYNGILHPNSKFHLATLREFRSLESLISKHIRPLEGIKGMDNETNSAPWLSKFIEWAKDVNTPSNDPCWLDQNTVVYNATHCFIKYISETGDINQLPTNEITKMGDGPVFDNIRHGRLLGYFSFVHTGAWKSTNDFAEIDSFIHQLDNLSSTIRSDKTLSIGSKEVLLIPSPLHISRYSELQNSLHHGMPISVAVSIGICALVVMFFTRSLWLSLISLMAIGTVVLATCASLVLMGWSLGIVETMIVVMAIGISFDHTLHTAMAYQYSPRDDPPCAKMIHTYEAIFTPVGFAVLSNLLAGVAILLLSETRPFEQIGEFLVVMSLWSWVVSIVIFPALMLCTSK